MIKVLITGKDSYIGTSFEQWLQKEPQKYRVDTIDMRMEKWKDKNFADYDVVFHVAGVAHISFDPKLEPLYYKVNRDLAVETAKKAKDEGVKQFIFMSSIIVYGDIGNTTLIDRNTKPAPNNFYGLSKLQAEEQIKNLASERFKIVVLRPPMIYGSGSKGNYTRLSKLAQIIPIFPDVDNIRSMLYVDNLSEFVKIMIDQEESGLFFPQNAEYVKTSEMVRLIAKVHGKKMIMIRAFNGMIKSLSRNAGLLNKMFGNLAYDMSLSTYDKGNYQIRSFRESIEMAEKERKDR